MPGPAGAQADSKYAVVASTISRPRPSSAAAMAAATSAISTRSHPSPSKRRPKERSSFLSRSGEDEVTVAMGAVRSKLEEKRTRFRPRWLGEAAGRPESWLTRNQASSVMPAPISPMPRIRTPQA